VNEVCAELIVCLELDGPEDRIGKDELDLIEQHLGDLLREMLMAAEDSKE
jgi:hypothetical protein